HIILAAVEAAVDGRLNAALQGLDESGNSQGRANDSELVRLSLAGQLIQEVLQGDNGDEIHQAEDARQRAVDEGAIDEHIDVPEPVAQHGEAERERDEEHGQVGGGEGEGADNRWSS